MNAKAVSNSNKKRGKTGARSSASAPEPPATYNSIDVAGIRRKQIVEAVRKIVSRDGLAAATIANIATELGTSRGVVVYHFANKEEILQEVLAAAMSDADELALRFEKEGGNGTLTDLILQVTKLAIGGSDWWRIYFAFLSHAHVNEFYREALAWSDERYRTALSHKLANPSQAAIVLALMKGLAMQVSVTPSLPVQRVQAELQELMERWLANASASAL